MPKGAKGAVDEKVLWELLAAEAEAAKIKLAEQVAMLMAARRPAAAEEHAELEHPAVDLRIYPAPAPPATNREIDEFELAQQLVGLQDAAESSSPAEQQQVMQSAQAAADQINLDEAETRALIDEQLRERGWEADTREPPIRQRCAPCAWQGDGNCRVADREWTSRLRAIRRFNVRGSRGGQTQTKKRCGRDRSNRPIRAGLFNDRRY